MRRIVIGAVPAVLLVGMACTDVDSEDLLTSGMSASITVTAQGDGQARTDAILRAGGQTSLTFVQLTADDALTVTPGDGAAVPLVEYEIGDLHGYAADTSGDDPATVYTVALTRTVDDGAPATTISLPAAFAIEAPATDFSRATDFALTWSPTAAEPMQLQAAGDCIDLYVTTIEADTGSYTVPGGTLTQFDGAAANCEVTFTLKRIKPGTLDTAYGEGGSALGIQVREVSSTSAP